MNPRIIKPSMPFRFSTTTTPSGSFPEATQPAPRPSAPEALPAPGPPPDRQEGHQEPAGAIPEDRAELVPIHLYRRHKDRLEALRTALAPGVKLSRSAAVRWLVDHHPDPD